MEGFEHQSKGQPKTPVDAHVHFHRRQFVEPTLDAAAMNFVTLAPRAFPIAGMLLLAESAREHVFDQLAAAESVGGWSIRAVEDEPQTVIARREEREIAIVCGRQVRCTFGLEVLALGTTVRYPDGCAAGETIARIQRDGAVPVLPWGFGKWLGRARSVVANLFNSSSPQTFFAGDNGGRLQLLGLPKQLRAASRAGFRVLPGTDPFPSWGDYRRAGSFGFLADLELDSSRPWRSLQKWLEASGSAPEPYGRGLGIFRFAINQSWIQIRNRVMLAGAA